jgi:formate dehydrogenase maturation protein FdhE
MAERAIAKAEGKMKPMTNEEYTRHAETGQLCPVCRSEQVTGSAIEIEEAGAVQSCECNDCGVSWVDVYVLTGYVSLEDTQGDYIGRDNE